MKCRWCGGRGDHGTYDPSDPYWRAIDPDITDEEAAADPGVSLCELCDGTGRVSACRRAREYWDDMRRWLNLSRVGDWWWRRVCRPIRVRRLVRDRSALQLAALCGERWRRRGELSRALENGIDCWETWTLECRLVDEAERAAKQKPWTPIHPSP